MNRYIIIEWTSVSIDMCVIIEWTSVSIDMCVIIEWTSVSIDMCVIIEWTSVSSVHINVLQKQLLMLTWICWFNYCY